MEVEIPDALVDDLQSMSICMSFKGGLDDRIVEDFEGDARLRDESWIHISSEMLSRTDSLPERWHFHIDLQKSFGPSKRPASFHQDNLKEHLQAALGKHDDNTLIQATFRVSVEALPTSGVIQPFIGISVSASSAKMALRGVTYKVDNAEVDELSWKLLKDLKNVEVCLKARRAITVQPSLLIDIQAQYAALFKQLVLETQ